MDVNSDLRKKELKLLSLARAHAKKEGEILTHLKEKNIEAVLDLILENNRLGEEIRNFFDEFSEPPQLRDFRALEQLRKIRSCNSKTDELVNVFTKLGYIVYKEIPEGEIQEKASETLNEMIEYLLNQAGYSVSFSQRKKDFGTLIVKSTLPKNIALYLYYIKNCYLLNMNEVVIGLCRILLEVACRKIYDSTPEKKLAYMDKEREFVSRVIGVACDARGLSHKMKEMARNRYDEASEILHGKLTKPKTDEECLNFVRDIFSIIEALY